MKYRVSDSEFSSEYNLGTEWMSKIRNRGERDDNNLTLWVKKNHKIIFKCYIEEYSYS